MTDGWVGYNNCVRILVKLGGILTPGCNRIPNVCIGNLALGIGMGPTLIPHFFAFGGVLGLGKNCKKVMKPKAGTKGQPNAEGCIIATVAVGINTADKKGNYYSGRFSKIMLSDILGWVTYHVCLS